MFTAFHIALGCGLEGHLRAACEGAQALLAGPALQPQDVHRIRVESKRLRALLQLNHDEATAPQRRQARRALRATAQALAAPRDAYALHQLVLGLCEASEHHRQRAALSILSEELGGRVMCSVEVGAQRDVMAASFAWASEQLEAWLSTTDETILRAALETSRQRCTEQWQRAHSEASAAALHVLRRRLKALLYQLDATLEPAWLKTKPRGRLQRLGSQLGECHDLWVLRSLWPMFDARLDAVSCAELERLLRRRERRLSSRALAKTGPLLHELGSLTQAEAERP